jgi:hypothetical protein
VPLFPPQIPHDLTWYETWACPLGFCVSLLLICSIGKITRKLSWDVPTYVV